MSKTIIETLDCERIRQGLSKYELTRRCGVGHNMWSEATYRGSTTLNSLLKICEALDVEIILVNKEGRNIY